MMTKSALLLLLALSIVIGTSASPQTPDSGAPVIRVTTRLVQINVVAHDRNGEPASDLTKDDFVLYDKGEEQKIRYFSRETNEPLPDYPSAAVEGVVSNHFVTATVDGKPRVQPLPNSINAILLDGLNTRFTDQYQAKEAVIQFLKQLHPGDRVAIY